MASLPNQNIGRLHTYVWNGFSKARIEIAQVLSRNVKDVV
jgi:hypothetical protein